MQKVVRVVSNFVEELWLKNKLMKQNKNKISVMLFDIFMNYLTTIIILLLLLLYLIGVTAVVTLEKKLYYMVTTF
jgi:hypothetical protein